MRIQDYHVSLHCVEPAKPLNNAQNGQVVLFIKRLLYIIKAPILPDGCFPHD